MKKFLIILPVLFILILIPFVDAKAYCLWREKQIVNIPNKPPQTVYCLGSEQQSATSSCQLSAPTSNSICCCGGGEAPKTVEQIAQEEKNKTTPPKFTIPDLQIKIPGMEKFSKANCTDEGQCEVPWIGEYISGIYDYALSIAGILAAIMLMAGGVLWLVSGGDASKITQAKELIISSITGLIILASSYVILIQINPDLINLNPITVNAVKKIELLANARKGSQANTYKDAPCATDAELSAGVDFYATGYYKPAWENSDKFRCVVAMQCTCPNGQDTSKNCDDLYGKTFPNYHPCKYFEKDIPYCNMTAGGVEPKIGDIAGPGNCRSNLPFGTKVCFKGQTYTITDTGSGIKGKRIDIWSGGDLDKANSVTGVGKLKKGACN